MERFVTAKKFYDNKNFPHGFNRGGDFSKAEADLLTQIGVYLSELHSGDRVATTPDEERILKVVEGELDARTPVEKVWAKYTRLIAVKTRRVKLSVMNTGTGFSEEPSYEADL